MVGYVGGSNYDGTFDWSEHDRLCHYDALVVGFAHEWSAKPGCAGPTEAGLDAMPQLLTNACIQKGPQWLGASPEFGACGLTQCGGEGEGTVGSSVLAYQQTGKRVLLSVGGANSHAENMSPSKGPALAQALWHMYLGGEDVRYTGWRPFGAQVVLDGVDIDLEQTPAACTLAPSSQGCLDVQEGWWAFVNTLRGLMDADSRKEYLITAVPINTKFADPAAGGFPGWGAYTHGFLPGIGACPTAFDVCTASGCPVGSAARTALDSQPPKSLFAVMHKIDFLWPQYYPSPTSITLNGDCWTNDLLAWTSLAIHAASRHPGEANRNRVGLGVPFSPGAANGGQIDASDAISRITEALRSSATGPTLAKTFGGMFGWDEFWDHKENQPTPYARQLALELAQPSFLSLVEGASSGANRVCERQSAGRRRLTATDGKMERIHRRLAQLEQSAGGA